MFMYKEQYQLTIAVAVICLVVTFVSLELLKFLAIPIPIIWWIGMIGIKIYKEKFKK